MTLGETAPLCRGAYGCIGSPAAVRASKNVQVQRPSLPDSRSREALKRKGIDKTSAPVPDSSSCRGARQFSRAARAGGLKPMGSPARVRMPSTGPYDSDDEVISPRLLSGKGQSAHDRGDGGFYSGSPWGRPLYATPRRSRSHPGREFWPCQHRRHSHHWPSVRAKGPGAVMCGTEQQSKALVLTMEPVSRDMPQTRTLYRAVGVCGGVAALADAFNVSVADLSQRLMELSGCQQTSTSRRSTWWRVRARFVAPRVELQVRAQRGVFGVLQAN